MTNRRTVTDEELDLLAEGELSNEERADLFRRLDEQPGEWKNCALAILETQALRGSVRECLKEPQIPLAQPQPFAAKTEETERGGDPARSHRLRWAAVSVLLAIVAGSLVGYGVGYSRGSAQMPDRLALEKTPLKPNADKQAEDPLQIAAEFTLSWLNVRDEKLLAVVLLDEGGDSRLVPVVSSQTLADQLRQIPEIPLRPEQIQKANQNGWNIMQHPQFITIDRPEAATKVVAVQMLRYKFAGNDAI